MDEARAVLERLDAIEALERQGAGAAEVLAEIRALVEATERWLAAEAAAGEQAGEALAETRRALARDQALVR